MDVDVKNLRIVSGSADNKICVSLISSQVSVLNAREWVGHSTKFYTSTLLDSLSVELFRNPVYLTWGAICLECNFPLRNLAITNNLLCSDSSAQYQ